MNNKLLIFMCHGGVKQFALENLRDYSKWFDDVVIVCPEGDKISFDASDNLEFKTIDYFYYGGRSSNRDTLRSELQIRFLLCCSYVYEKYNLTHDVFCFAEYDVWMIKYPDFDINSGDEFFIQTITCGDLTHNLISPWIFSRRSLELFCQKSKNYNPEIVGNGFLDRYIFSVCMLDEPYIYPIPIPYNYNRHTEINLNEIQNPKIYGRYPATDPDDNYIKFMINLSVIHSIKHKNDKDNIQNEINRIRQ